MARARTAGRARVVAVAAVAVVATMALAGPASALAPGVPSPSDTTASSPWYRSPGVPPPGANDFACEPSEERPHPVVLVHGTFGDMTVSWNALSPLLAERGHCVFALDYGDRGTGDIVDSAGELADFVDEVLAATGAERVSIVGHSQGGMMPRYFLRYLGGTDLVADLVGLSPSNDGTTMPLAPHAWDCPACQQQVAGSDFLEALNQGTGTWGRVAHTQVQTRYDQVVTPYDSAFLEEGRRVTNVLLQDACPENVADHVGIIYDPVALQWVVHALERPGPADPAHQPRCGGAALALR